MRKMAVVVHGLAGGVALLTIASFWLATVTVEVFGDMAAVAAVKQGILWGMAVLIPSLMIAGGSGTFLARGWRGGLADAKRRRMPVIAANGLIVLVPAAVFLCWRAGEGLLDATFYIVQAVELVAGAVNLTLLGLNMRDGLRLSRRRSRPAVA